MTADEFLKKLINKENLTKKESGELVRTLFEQNTSATLVAAILTALKMKGETYEEILGFVGVLRQGMKKIDYRGILVDTCGTGGDGTGTFNISTATAIVAASCGVKIAKHGNRSASGLTGSADVLEAAGVNINLDEDGVKRSLAKANIAFLFAPYFHPLMKQIGLIRREIKIRTIFNLIGPLLNPMSVNRQIIGVASLELAETLSKVVQQLPFEHVVIVHSDDGMDEVSIYGKTKAFEVKKGKLRKFEINAKKFGLSGENIEEIRVKNAVESKEKLLAVLQGKGGDLRKIVLINSGAALYVSGKYKNFKEGITAAKKAIDSGKAMATFKSFIRLSNGQ